MNHEHEQSEHINENSNQEPTPPDLHIQEEEKAAEKPEANLEEECALLKDQLLRALAESENIRKRAAKEKEDAHQYAISNFAKEILTVADNLTRALESIPEAERQNNQLLNNIFIGVDATNSELMKIFEKSGIRPVPSIGQKVDPHLHRVMLEEENAQIEPGLICKEFQKGYMIHDRLLREAMVSVAKK